MRGLDDAIRTEILLQALGSPDAPRTIADLLHALEGMRLRGLVAEELVLALRERARSSPDASLDELRRRNGFQS